MTRQRSLAPQAAEGAMQPQESWLSSTPRTTNKHSACGRGLDARVAVPLPVDRSLSVDLGFLLFHSFGRTSRRLDPVRSFSPLYRMIRL